ncbi:MAG: hypothetical protein Q4C70_10340, partial [Planctomycetia bacterium]|nr:hypothetical protein [Planctomycetia bacterium]
TENGTKWEIPWKADWENDDETVWDMSLAQTGKMNRIAELKMTPNRNVPDELKMFVDFTWKPEFALSDTLLIQTADGKEMRSGRDILGTWNTRLGQYAHRVIQMKMSSRNEYASVKLEPGEEFRLPATCGLYYELFALEDTVAVQDEVFYFFNVERPGNYRLSATVLAPDARRDSLQVTFWLPDIPKGVHYPCWALGNSSEWRTVAFSVPGNKKVSKDESKSEYKDKIETETPGVLYFPAGPMILRLKPREYDVRVRELILERI